MDAPNGTTMAKKRVVTVKLPGISIGFAGRLAFIPLFILAAPVVIVLVYTVRFATWSWLWVSAALWILFIAYWGAAARNSAKTAGSEPAASRQLHQLLMYGALALLFWRAPGRGGRWLPAAA